jgi:hypothetical protein
VTEQTTSVITETTARERIAGLLATTRYSPRAGARRDKHGMPIIAPEAADPDDE